MLPFFTFEHPCFTFSLRPRNIFTAKYIYSLQKKYWECYTISMMQKILLILGGIFIGFGIGYSIIFYTPLLPLQQKMIPFSGKIPSLSKKQVIGFLPYWLVDKANTGYSKYITTLTYFGLAIDSDGTILKRSNPQELQPGWNALNSGKLYPFFQSSHKQNVSLSLLIDTGNIDVINSIIANPVPNARNLVQDVKPFIRRYGFSDLNLDIEYTQEASDSARLHFIQFVQEVKKELPPHTTLTIEISPLDVIKKQLIDLPSVGKIADNIVLMAYDYHSPDSYVTGAIAPLFGAGTLAEYDVATAVEKARQLIPSPKIILGIPLYGYEWETIGTIPHSAIIPDTGVLASNNRVEQLLDTCASCSAKYDTEAQEAYLVYKDASDQTYHQIFYPDKKTTSAKITFANQQQLGGIALWALGYEGNTLLTPLTMYKKD